MAFRTSNRPQDDTGNESCHCIVHVQGMIYIYIMLECRSYAQVKTVALFGVPGRVQPLVICGTHKRDPNFDKPTKFRVTAMGLRL